MIRPLLAAVTLLLSAQAAEAQQDVIEAMGARARRLRAAADTALAVERRAKLLLENAPRDTIRTDPFVVYVARGEGPRVTSAVRLASARARQSLGDAANLLRSHPLRLAFGVGTVGSSGAVPIIGLPDSAGTDEIADVLMRWAGPLLSAGGSSALREWTVIPVNVDTAELRLRAHVEMATAIPGASARCLAGGIAECAVALGLTMPDDPVTAYWDAVGRRAMVRRTARIYFRGERRVLADDCLERGLDAACTEYLRRAMEDDRDRRALELAPLGTAPRQLVLVTALRLGGAGAMERLLSDTTRGLVESIETAAGTSLHDVLTAWRSGLLATRPDPGLTPGSRFLGVLWMLVFAGMALGGTRWRAG